jgi:hypothetical protein
MVGFMPLFAQLLSQGRLSLLVPREDFEAFFCRVCYNLHASVLISFLFFFCRVLDPDSLTIAWPWYSFFLLFVHVRLHPDS